MQYGHQSSETIDLRGELGDLYLDIGRRVGGVLLGARGPWPVGGLRGVDARPPRGCHGEPVAGPGRAAHPAGRTKEAPLHHVPSRGPGALEAFEDAGLKLRTNPLVETDDPDDGRVRCLQQDDAALADLIIRREEQAKRPENDEGDEVEWCCGTALVYNMEAGV